MKTIWILFFSLFTGTLFGQSGEEKLEKTLKEFHQSLVGKNKLFINQHTDEALSYGHSNGWVETKTDLIRNLETGYLMYSGYKEDSLSVVVHENVGHARFVADIDVALNGSKGSYHLKVLEVWVKKKGRWLLFARQALK